ncbi:MAG: BspA family leucine-rich repeat surface protein, partial [Halieaceae bacterium]
MNGLTADSGDCTNTTFKTGSSYDNLCTVVGGYFGLKKNRFAIEFATKNQCEKANWLHFVNVDSGQALEPTEWKQACERLQNGNLPPHVWRSHNSGYAAFNGLYAIGYSENKTNWTYVGYADFDNQRWPNPPITQIKTIKRDPTISADNFLGTQCEDGKVKAQAAWEAAPIGPDQTLYVRGKGAFELEMSAESNWSSLRPGRTQDKLQLVDVASGEVVGPPWQISTKRYGEANFGRGRSELFGAAGPQNNGPEIPDGTWGNLQLQFVSGRDGAITPVGTLYKVGETDSCEAPGPLPPEAPAISDIEPLDQEAMLYLTEPLEIEAEITGYQYQTRRHENSGHQQSDTWHDAGDASSPIVIRYFEEGTPLVNGETYSVQVRAVNIAGPGEASIRSETFSPYAAAPPVPDAPEIIGVTTGNGTATISFSVPASNGAPITNFAIRYTTQFGQTESALTPASPEVTEGPVTIDGLTNGERYTISIAAINANGMGPDSNEVEFTPGTQCEDVTDWSVPDDTLGYFCSVGLNDYAYADFHILTTDGTDVCSERSTYLPTAEGDYQGLFCNQTDTNTLRAIFNWNNGSRNKTLSWLVDVEQIGSRTRAGVPCESTGEETVAGRCANQLSSGKRAFQGMAGEGGAGIANLDTSNVTDMEEMFLRASTFNQNIGGWDTSKVERMSRMFTRASAFDKDIGGWNTSTVRDMAFMFDQAAAFNQDLHQWDVSNIDSKPNSFDGGTDNWTGIDPVTGFAWCNEGRPQWGKDGSSGCSTTQAPDEIIEAILSGGIVIG